MTVSPTPLAAGNEEMMGWLREDGMGVGTLAMQRKRWARVDGHVLYLYENEKVRMCC